MQPTILTTGAHAWKAGHTAIREGTFRFNQTAEDEAFNDLKRYAAERATTYLTSLGARYAIAPDLRSTLFAVYVRAFCNGAFDEVMEQP